MGNKGYRITIINGEGLILACSQASEHLALNMNNMPIRIVFEALPQTLVEFTEENIEKLECM